MMRITRTTDGTFSLKLAEGERALLAGLVEQLRDLLVTDDAPSLTRLYPPAYAYDEEREKEYQALVHDELLEKRLAALDIVQTTADATELEPSELHAWMGAINDVRLVLGTMLDVEEDMDEIDPDDPRAGSFAVYSYLTHLLGEIVHVLADW